MNVSEEQLHKSGKYACLPNPVRWSSVPVRQRGSDSVPHPPQGTRVHHRQIDLPSASVA
jgi:hypothetical protein